MAKYNTRKYKIGPFHGGSNININHIRHSDNIAIQLVLQSYMLYWHHVYLLCPGIYIMEAIIFQHFYSTSLRKFVWK